MISENRRQNLAKLRAGVLLVAPFFLAHRCQWCGCSSHSVYTVMPKLHWFDLLWIRPVQQDEPYIILFYLTLFYTVLFEF